MRPETDRLWVRSPAWSNQFSIGTFTPLSSVHRYFFTLRPTFVSPHLSLHEFSSCSPLLTRDSLNTRRKTSGEGGIRGSSRSQLNEAGLRPVGPPDPSSLRRPHAAWRREEEQAGLIPLAGIIKAQRQGAPVLSEKQSEWRKNPSE